MPTYMFTQVCFLVPWLLTCKPELEKLLIDCHVMFKAAVVVLSLANLLLVPSTSEDRASGSPMCFFF